MHDLRADPILIRFRAALDKIYRQRLQRVVLFGSRARGDADPNSDYDVAVFLRDMPDRAAELNRLADISTDIAYEIGERIHAMPYRAGTYSDPRMPLMHEIRQGGSICGAAIRRLSRQIARSACSGGDDAAGGN